MKKFLAIMFAVLMVVSLVACGDDTGNTGTTEGSNIGETVATTEAAKTFAVGDTGNGAETISNEVFKVTVPEGLQYSIYTWAGVDGHTDAGTWAIDLGTDNTNSARLTISTQRIIKSLDEAEAECIRMNDYGGAKESATEGDKAFAGIDYKLISFTNDMSVTKCYAGYFNNGAEFQPDIYVELMAYTEGSYYSIQIEDALITELMESLELTAY